MHAYVKLNSYDTNFDAPDAHFENCLPSDAHRQAKEFCEMKSPPTPFHEENLCILGLQDFGLKLLA
jgi:hypothetical protein